jgi:hypothetical protein
VFCVPCRAGAQGGEGWAEEPLPSSLLALLLSLSSRIGFRQTGHVILDDLSSHLSKKRLKSRVTTRELSIPAWGLLEGCPRRIKQSQEEDTNSQKQNSAICRIMPCSQGVHELIQLQSHTVQYEARSLGYAGIAEAVSTRQHQRFANFRGTCWPLCIWIRPRLLGQERRAFSFRGVGSQLTGFWAIPRWLLCQSSETPSAVPPHCITATEKEARLCQQRYSATHLACHHQILQLALTESTLSPPQQSLPCRWDSWLIRIVVCAELCAGRVVV